MTFEGCILNDVVDAAAVLIVDAVVAFVIMDDDYIDVVASDVEVDVGVVVAAAYSVVVVGTSVIMVGVDVAASDVDDVVVASV